PPRRSEIPFPRPPRRRHRRRHSSVGALTRRRRWPKRAFIAFGSLLGVVIIGAGALFFYARWRFDQIPKVTVAGLTPRVGNQPFDVLLVGSDSRSFVSDASQAAQFGSEADASGQRSDVDIIARFAPALGEVKLLSIPRDTYVNIPGHVSNIS